MQDSLALRPIHETLIVPLWPFVVVLLLGVTLGAAVGWWWRGRRSRT